MIKKHTISIFITLLFFTYSSLKAQTVYITDSGKKYHTKNCSSAKTGKNGIELAEAKKQGYDACKVCKAYAIEDKSKKGKKTNTIK